VTVDESFIGSSGDVNVKGGGTLSVNAGRGFATTISPAVLNNFDIHAGGDVALAGGSGVSVVDTAIYAGNSAELTGKNGNVLMEDADITATTGNVNILAAYGNVTLDSGTAEHGVTVSAGGGVTLNADGTISISDSSITAGGDVNIIAASKGYPIGGIAHHSAHFAPSDVAGGPVVPAIFGNGIQIFKPADHSISQNDIDLESQTITDPGSIDLTAVNTVTVNDSTLNANGGHVGILGGGTVTITGSSLYAYGGDANIASSGSTVDIEDSFVAANGDVIVHGSGSLTLGSVSGNTIEAMGGVSLTSDSGDADIYGSTIHAYGQAAGRNVDISAGLGSVDFENNEVYAYAGGVSIKGAGDVYVGGAFNDIYAYYGDLEITSQNSTVEVLNTYLYASQNLQVTSAGMLTVNAGHDFGGSFYEDIYAGDSVTLSGGTSASVVDTAIYAKNLVTILSGNGDVLVRDADIETGPGNVAISATSGNLTLDSGAAKYGVFIEAGSVNLNADLDVNIHDSSLYSDNGEVNIKSKFGKVDVQNSDIEASENLSITSAGTLAVTKLGTTSSSLDVDILGSTLTSDNGVVQVISYNGNVDVENSGISAASSSVDIEAGYVDYTGVGLETLTLIHDNIAARDSATFYAPGDVTIYGNQPVPNDLTAARSDISAHEGSVNIASFYGSVDIEDMNIRSGSTHNVDIFGISLIQAGGNANIYAQGGTVSISAAEDLTLYNLAIDLGGDISISGGSTIIGEDGVNITTVGMLSISGNGTEEISGVTVSGNNISISDSTITAKNGDVNIEDNNILALPDTGGFDLSQANHIGITAGSTITANAGNVNISTDGGVDLANSTVSAKGSAGTTGNVTVNAGAGITVNGASLSGDAAAGTIALTSTAGQTTIENGASAQAFYLNVNSSDGILIDGTSGGGVHLSGNIMNLKGSYTDSNKGITLTGTPVNPVDLSSFATVNMAAHTINLSFVGFGAGSYDNFQTFYGALAANPNTGSAPQSGYLNFINGVTYAGTLITSGNQSTYVNPVSGPGVRVTTLP
jgi:hypothetical protein